MSPIPITKWQINEEKIEQQQTILEAQMQIETADMIKAHSLFMAHLDSARNITANRHMIQAMTSFQ